MENITFEQWMIEKVKYSWHKKYQKYYDEWLSNCPNHILDGYKRQYMINLEIITHKSLTVGSSEK